MKETKILRAASPEAVGVSPEKLAALMEDIAQAGLEIHSVMVLRHGKVAYESFRKPYAPQYPHVMFSVSKSITSCAVGFAVAEGKLTLEDRVADLVPELRGDKEDPRLEALTVRHLLTMTSGKVVNVMIDKARKTWIKDYADAKFSYPPGEGWNYSNESIYILCVIIRRVCGECVVDYLMPRLFEPLNIPRPFWENDGGGVEAGGWGLYLTTESLAKIMLCYTQGGKYEGRQVVPADWVAESGKAQVMQGDAHPSTYGGSGYGFCFWKNPAGESFRADGVFSQFGLIFPEQDACVVTTAGQMDSNATLEILFRYFPQAFEESGDRDQESGDRGQGSGVEIPALPDYPVLEPRPRNMALEYELEDKMITFPAPLHQAPRVVGMPVSMMPMAVFFMSADKAGGINKIRLRFTADACKLSWSEGEERNTVLCGMDGRARNCKVTLGGIDFTVACSAAWDGQHKLRIWIRVLNSVAERRLTFYFRGRQVTMVPRSSPSLASVAEYAAPYAASWIPSAVLGSIVANTMDKLTMMAEPPHIGILREFK